MCLSHFSTRNGAWHWGQALSTGLFLRLYLHAGNYYNYKKMFDFCHGAVRVPRHIPLQDILPRFPPVSQIYIWGNWNRIKFAVAPLADHKFCPALLTSFIGFDYRFDRLSPFCSGRSFWYFYIPGNRSGQKCAITPAFERHRFAAFFTDFLRFRLSRGFGPRPSVCLFF